MKTRQVRIDEDVYKAVQRYAQIHGLQFKTFNSVLRDMMGLEETTASKRILEKPQL